ncbi:MAG: DedA family protein [Phycisphaerales bacterium]|nr:DedA family protein [Phycisphaerales bacterium]
MEGIFLDFLSRASYLGLFAVLIAAGFGLPLPEDIPLIIAGLIVRHTHGDDIQPLVLMILTGFAGVMIGDSCLFYLGRKYGAGIVEKRWFRKIAKPWLLEKARDKFENHGAKILFAARFMPGIRAVMFLTAGVFRVPYWKLLVFDGSAALFSVPAWIWAGWYFSEKIKVVFDSARIGSFVLGGVLVGSLIAWGFWEYYHNLRKKNRPPEILVESPSGILEEATASLESQSGPGEPAENHPELSAAGNSIIDNKTRPSKVASGS